MEGRDSALNEVRDAVAELTAVVKQAPALPPKTKDSSSNSTITVNAGGVGIWICAAACVAILAAMIVGSVIGGMWLSREAQRIEKRAAEQEVKIDRANVLLSATWQHVPEVAEKVKQEHPEESADAE